MKNRHPHASLTASPARRQASARLFSALLAAGLAVSAAPSAQAATTTRTWNAASTTGNGDFNSTGNWNTSAAMGSDNLIFGGDSAFGAINGHVLNNNVAGLQFNQITFNAGAPNYTIGGNAFTLYGSVSNNSTSLQTLSTAIASANATHTFTTTAGGGDLAVTGGMTGTQGSFVKAGAGTLTISNTNGYSVATSVTAGTLNLTGSLTGGTAISTTGTGVFSQSSSGAISGASTFTQGSSGTSVLSGTNSYTGVTTVNAGTLQFAKTASLYSGTDTNWTAAKINVKSGGTLALNVGGTGEFTTGNVTTLLTNLAATSSATVGMNAGSTLGFDTTNASGGTFTVSDIIGNTTGTKGGARGLTKLGTGTLVLSGTNSYSGATQVNGGILTFANTAAKSTSTTVTAAAAGTVGLGVGAASGDYTDANVASLFNTNSLTGFNLNAASGVALDTTAGNFTQSTALTFARALTKLGVNTLTLSGNNSYTGATTISGGTLALGVNNAIAAGSDIALTSGTFDLKTFTESAKSLTMSAGSTLKFDLSTAGLNSPTALLALSGGFTMSGSGTFNLDFSNQTFASDNTYKLTSFTGTTFTANDFTLGGFSVANGEALSLSVVGGALMLTASAIPEPATYAVLAGLGILILAAYRRRKTS